MRPMFMIAVCLVLGACGSSSEEADYASDGYATYASDGSGAYRAYDEVEEARGEFNEDAAREAAIAELDGQSYQDINGYAGCTDDCGGHDAGFAWAQDNAVEDGGVITDSTSFDEGANAYATAIDERVDAMRADYENGDSTFEQ